MKLYPHSPGSDSFQTSGNSSWLIYCVSLLRRSIIGSRAPLEVKPPESIFNSPDGQVTVVQVPNSKVVSCYYDVDTVGERALETEGQGITSLVLLYVPREQWFQCDRLGSNTGLLLARWAKAYALDQGANTNLQVSGKGYQNTSVSISKPTRLIPWPVNVFFLNYSTFI